MYGKFEKEAAEVPRCLPRSYFGPKKAEVLNVSKIADIAVV